MCFTRFLYSLRLDYNIEMIYTTPMKKTNDERREDRIKEIFEITKQRDALNTRLNYLTGVVETTNVNVTENPIPANFSLMREIEELFNEHKQLRILQATALLQKKFPQYNIERSKVHSTMAYLAKKSGSKIKKEAERGLFALEENTS